MSEPDSDRPISFESTADSNPYSAPIESPAIVVPDEMRRGRFAQVRVVAILTIVQGSLVVCYGLVMTGMMGFLIVVSQSQNPAFDPLGGNNAPPGMETMVIFLYGGLGGLMTVTGGLTIHSGIRLLYYRNRVYGIVMLVVGLACMISCYCAPTAIGLAIYGLIVLTNGPVVRAFAMVQEGRSVQEIEHHFNNLPAL
ncbi:MAG: hypothetical protein KDA96_12195 [Planctomycetaceae bacterium]|nr:hypothetical protein [Planctomycetaceae bacterium]